MVVGNTPPRSLRVDDETWQAAQERAELEHRAGGLSEVIRIALRDYADGTYDAQPRPVKRKRAGK